MGFFGKKEKDYKVVTREKDNDIKIVKITPDFNEAEQLARDTIRSEKQPYSKKEDGDGSQYTSKTTKIEVWDEESLINIGGQQSSGGKIDD